MTTPDHPDTTIEDLAAIRRWHDAHTDPQLRHRTLPSGMAALWKAIDLLLRELDRRVDPDDLNDEQTAIYEAGYVAGQRAVGAQLRQLAAGFDYCPGPPTTTVRPD
jgi:hypothetical protein